MCLSYCPPHSAGGGQTKGVSLYERHAGVCNRMSGLFGTRDARGWKVRGTALMAVVLASSAVFAARGAEPSGAISPAFVQNQVTTSQDVDMICRAYGGSLSANSEADQVLNYAITAPDVVQPGETYVMKIRPG